MILLSLMLVLSMACSVCAATANYQSEPIDESDLSDFEHGLGSATRDTQVTLALQQSFEILVPDDFSITEDDTESGKYTGLAPVEAQVHLLDAGNTLTVSVSSEQNEAYSHDTSTRGNNFWVLKDNSASPTKELKYIIKAASTTDDHANKNDSSRWLAEGEPIISVSNPTPITKYLHLLVYDTVTTVGTFTDTLTFTVTVTSSA